MIQALPRLMTFQEFLAWKPETERYELHDGVIVEMQPTITVCHWVNGMYETQLFRRGDGLVSPGLRLSVEQVISLG